MRDNNYYNIYFWMRSKLKLSGKEVDIYAVIYGFSQDDGSYFKGSCQYLANLTGVSKRSVITILSKLVEKGCLIKIKNGKYFDYKVDQDYIFNKTGEKSSSVIGEVASPLTGEKSSPVKPFQAISEVASPMIGELASPHIANINKLDIIQGDSDEPPDEKTGSYALLNRDPRNNKELVEKTWLSNYKNLYNTLPISPAWGISAPLIKRAIDHAGVDTVISALNHAMQDAFCLKAGYNLKTIMSGAVISRLINEVSEIEPEPFGICMNNYHPDPDFDQSEALYESY